jgi:hypothetical protein
MKLTKLSAALAATDGPMIKMAAALAAGSLALAVLSACGSGPDFTGVEVIPAGESDLLAPGVEIAGDYDPTPDVALGKCKAGEFGDVAAPVTVKNSTGAARAYTITVEVVKGSVQVATLDAFVNHLRAGQSTTVDANGYVEDPKATAGTTCKLLVINSYEIQ